MKQIFLIIAAMSLLCLAPMPYGYYMLFRFVVMVVFGLMAYQYYDRKKEMLAVIFGALSLLFQPFVKIALGRFMWNTIDVIVAIVLVLLFFTEGKSK